MIVLDCSAAVHMTRETAEGLALSTLMLEGERAIAPTLFKYELVNALRKYVHAGMMTLPEAEKKSVTALALVDEFCDMDDAVAEVLAESARLNHSAYDMFYFVLARRHAATLFTLDKKLQRLCEENGVECVHDIDFAWEEEEGTED